MNELEPLQAGSAAAIAVMDDDLFSVIEDPCWFFTFDSAWRRRQVLSETDLKELRAMRKRKAEYRREAQQAHGGAR